MGGSGNKGKPRAMVAVEEVDISAVRYKPPTPKASHLMGFSLKAFVWLMESPLLGTLITSLLKAQKNITQIPQKTVISERPMYYPEYPPQGAAEKDPSVRVLLRVIAMLEAIGQGRPTGEQDK